MALPGTGNADPFVTRLRQDLCQPRQGPLAEGFFVQGRSRDAKTLTIEHRTDPVFRQGAGHPGRSDAFRRHHGSQHEVELPVAEYRYPYRKGELPGGSAGQLADHRPVLGNHLGKAVRFGQGTPRCPIVGRDPPHDLAVGSGEQYRPPPRDQGQYPSDLGGEVVEVLVQQGRLGERLQDGHGTAQFDFDGGRRLATGFQRPLLRFALLVLHQQPETEAGHQGQGHDPRESDRQQAVAQGDQTLGASDRRWHVGFNGGKSSF